MKEKELARWSTMREKGMLMFVLINGLLAWGAPMFVVMTFIVPNFVGAHSRLPVAIAALIWACAGLFYGVAVWLWQEHRYRKAMEAPGS